MKDEKKRNKDNKIFDGNIKKIQNENYYCSSSGRG
jgi:hypothetical protein